MCQVLILEHILLETIVDLAAPSMAAEKDSEGSDEENRQARIAVRRVHGRMVRRPVDSVYREKKVGPI